jgi:hypothetical protein
VGQAPRTFAVHTLKLENVQYSEEYDSSSRKIVRMTYVFIYRPATWTIKRDDIGYNQLDDSGKLIPIPDATGVNPKTMPTWLDGNGKPLAAGSDVVQLTFENVKDTDMAPLLTEIG